MFDGLRGRALEDAALGLLGGQLLLLLRCFWNGPVIAKVAVDWRLA